MSKNGSGMYFGGIPTGPDVERLMEAYPVDGLVPGVIIPYVDTGKAIHSDVRSSRWKTITNAWRRKLENESNIIIECDPLSASFYVLSEGEKVGLSRKKLRSSVKLARRSMVVSAQVDIKQLSVEQRKDHDFNTNKAAAVIASGQLRANRKALPEMTAQ